MLEPEKINELHTQIQYRLIEKLTESERRYRTLVENLREIVFECDHTGMLTFVNQAWTATLGYPVKEVIGQCLDQFIDRIDVEKWQTALEAKIDCCLELRFYGADGTMFWLELAVQFKGGSSFSGALINITERKQAETLLKQANEDLEDRVKQRTAELSKANQELQHTIQRLQYTQGQLVHKEKMSSLGQLVAGVAHEINNPVSFVHGNLEPAQEYVQEMLVLIDLYQQHYPQPVSRIQDSLEACDVDFIKRDFPRLLNSMAMGTDRIKKIVDSLRSFSRLDESALKKVDIHEGIDNTLLILSHRLSGTQEIQLIKDYGELPLVDCFPDQLNQVFMNLLSNAIDALLGASPDGEVVLPHQGLPAEPMPEPLPEPLIIVRTYGDANSAMVEIIDNGPGISKEVISRVFDPFFTTKPVGKGTGLGLSISHQIIVEAHGGRISCISNEGEGATFRVQLPIALSQLHLQQQVDSALQPSVPN
ncbi:PAS domain S-box protein [Leptolyngbya cf. ectocarpi LEGE 11479]|uniref:histidine kinase n=1 Tax=Leptolyngbya cf. ectocarpi LEGE 11479 TaxID=1828722 RepID=A0A929FBL0_LEPEC|nr:ATP-binding protein [Leptolyngbya ectocarpi]MBE9069099.1 PAS domain S-box protein [Leptolyngbya cf. ectocarpi LEGE 11479]